MIEPFVVYMGIALILMVAGIVLWQWWVSRSTPAAPIAPSEPSRGYDIAAQRVQRPGSLEVVANEMPFQAASQTDPRRDLYEALLEADDNLRRLGHNESDRAKMIDAQFGSKVFRAVKPTPPPATPSPEPTA